MQDRICFGLWPFASSSYEYLFDIYFTSVPPTSLISLWSGHISCLSWCSLTLSPIWYLGSICWIKTNDLSQLEAKGMKDWNGLCEDNCYPRGDCLVPAPIPFCKPWLAFQSACLRESCRVNVSYKWKNMRNKRKPLCQRDTL